MAPTLFEKKPEPGDLIEILRGTYQHWAVYIGNGFIIHLVPPSEIANAGINSMMSVVCDEAVVKMEKLSEVVGTDNYRINNLLDDKYEPRSCHVIVKDAKSRVGQKLPYCIFRRNCEHFVTELRYDKPESRQVIKARDAGLAFAGAAAAVGLAVFAVSAFLGGRTKEKENYK